MDLWPITVRARRSLLSVFEELDEDRWELPSLCDGWTIREVLGHLILATRPPLRRYAVAVARARGNFDAANHALAVEEARRPVSALLDTYRELVDHRFSPPGWPAAAPLSDALLHDLDVRIPLGLESDQPAEHYEPALDLLLSRVGRSFARAGRPEVRWHATDLNWSRGDGPAVRGPMADLALTTAGRSARVDSLEGDGVHAIRSWLL